MYDSGSTVVNIITLDAKIVILGIAVVSLLNHFRSSPIFFPVAQRYIVNV